MAIQFARIEIVSRSSGGNACCKGAYNARTIVKDQASNVTYNFQARGDNVYHAVLLPDSVDKKFESVSTLMNEVERSEKRKNSQLLKDIVLALPDDKELTLEDRIEITNRLIEKRKWVKEGLAVQVDIHEPHDGEKNWHAHLLVTTRRFTADGLRLGEKARDLNPEFKSVGDNSFIIPEADQIHEDLKDIINDYFKELGLENRVDAIAEVPQEHIGPTRMRKALNEAVIRNEERRIVNLESLRSGSDVIDRITSKSSLFDQKDLERTVKCVPDERIANSLVEDALAQVDLVKLYHQDGSEAGLYTTKEIREEEIKLVRLGGYIAGQNNLTKNEQVSGLVEQLVVQSELEGQGRSALSHLLLGEGGIRVLKGRAGTGKSRLLGEVCRITKEVNIKTLALAPTHKAKLELSSVGFENSDTIKGFLFKLHNDRANLVKNSLIVVDEAAMVGNDDYLELLRVAASKNCNVILSGDERQLSSIQRGGMFEVFADKFGASVLSRVKRQKMEWGKEVAIYFSTGEVRSGLEVLQENGKLVTSDTKVDSMYQLLTNWKDSKLELKDRLIIAVKNKDVDLFNEIARDCLKESGVLGGNEYIVEYEDGKESVGFMKGDRIVFKQNDKGLNINNGDFGTITDLDGREFTVELDRGGEVSFDPNKFNGFRHGYASTVYKAQGASIKDVYVYHDGFSTMKNAYVAMSRMREDVHLYTNRESTKNFEQLIKQLRHDPERGSSLNYFTQEDLQLQQNKQEQSLLGRITSYTKEQITKLVDKHKVNLDYYAFQAEKQETSKAKVEEVLELMHEYLDEEQAEVQELKMVANGNNTRFKSSQSKTPKQKFYENVERKRNSTQKIDYKHEDERLRHEAKLSSERIAKDLLGEPNKRMSNKTTIRYGDKGSLAIGIRGTKAGIWYDFSKDKGGDIFDLVQESRGCDFKSAAEYLKSALGIERQSHLRLVSSNEMSDKYVDQTAKKLAEKAELLRKIKQSQSLYEKAKTIGDKSVARKYLSQRGITCDLNSDIKTTGILDKEIKTMLPAIVAFARNSEGKITGRQEILLDPETASKAKVATPKKSFGKIAGSFVEVASAKNKITIIAEGLETALSIKQAGIDARILCSLGISNIQNYQPTEGEQVIIAADNDGEQSNTDKVIESAKSKLSKTAKVYVVKPEEQGDFNDVLKNKGQGEAKIRELLEPVLARCELQYKIDQELSSLTLEGIDIGSLKSRVYNYLVYRKQATQVKALQAVELRNLINRSLFEMRNEQKIKDELYESGIKTNPERKSSFAFKLKVERVANMVTKVGGRLVEEGFKGKEDEIIKSAIAICNKREDKITELLQTNTKIQGLKPTVQRSVAEQLVDYQMQHGKEASSDVSSGGKFDDIHANAMAEEQLLPRIKDQLAEHLHNDDEILEGQKLITNRMRRSLSQDYHNQIISNTVKEIHHLQEQNTLEEKQHKGMGMNMGM